MILMSMGLGACVADLDSAIVCAVVGTVVASTAVLTEVVVAMVAGPCGLVEPISEPSSNWKRTLLQTVSAWLATSMSLPCSWL